MTKTRRRAQPTSIGGRSASLRPAGPWRRPASHVSAKWRHSRAVGAANGRHSEGDGCAPGRGPADAMLGRLAVGLTEGAGNVPHLSRQAGSMPQMMPTSVRCLAATSGVVRPMGRRPADHIGAVGHGVRHRTGPSYGWPTEHCLCGSARPKVRVGGSTEQTSSLRSTTPTASRSPRSPTRILLKQESRIWRAFAGGLHAGPVQTTQSTTGSPRVRRPTSNLVTIRSRHEASVDAAANSDKLCGRVAIGASRRHGGVGVREQQFEVTRRCETGPPDRGGRASVRARSGLDRHSLWDRCSAPYAHRPLKEPTK